jgi:hypothetical protein
MGLPLQVGFRGLPLIVERVELLRQAILGRTAGVRGEPSATLRNCRRLAIRLGDQLAASGPSEPASATSGVYGLFGGPVDEHIVAVLRLNAIEQSSPVVPSDRLIATA